MTNTREIIAYEVYPPAEMQLVPASVFRPWMEATENRFAYRCLPLAMANQAGWIVPCPASFSARWDGGPQPSGVALLDLAVLTGDTQFAEAARRTLIAGSDVIEK